ncbi:hypothetical protein DMUE_0109 [Dictyocoela muelleri]|nr:hypothetical protein DMUE_0109 [Dictyocoela muelleri]
MDLPISWKKAANENILKIEKLEVVTPENKANMLVSFIKILQYLCDVGKSGEVDFRNDEIIKKLPSIIKRKYEHILKLLTPHLYHTRLHCYSFLRARSGLHS